MAKTLDAQEILARLAQLDGWTLAADGGAIEKRYVFKDFAQAFAFMAHGALAAERLNHHPEWTNVYNRVAVRLSTHDAGGVTERDFALARALDGA